MKFELLLRELPHLCETIDCCIRSVRGRHTLLVLLPSDR